MVVLNINRIITSKSTKIDAKEIPRGVSPGTVYINLQKSLIYQLKPAYYHIRRI